MKQFGLALLVVLAARTSAPAQSKPSPPQTIAGLTSGMTRHDGLVPYFWDQKAGKIWLEVSSFGPEFIYVTYLSRGLGSNDIGLDRGLISSTHVVYFRRIGPKVLLMEKNYAFRVTSGDPDQMTAVEESFAQSTLWGFEVAAEDTGRVLLDATAFLMRDAGDVTGQLSRTGQGRFALEASRSALEPERTRNFPKNTEFEAQLTFTADTAGYFVRTVAPTPTSFTIGQHHSFVELPEQGYTPRRNDPRAGYFDISYVDHSTPLGQPMTNAFIMRHRLQKINPGPAPSRVVEPIVYYVDRGAPEPMRTALVEGAAWWNEAFEAAGFIEAFQVKLLPEDADPLDIRYNVIQWVHRATRGWSYGYGVVDPRTGEVLKGHVTLGSLRVRQDYLIAEGILTPYGDDETTDPRMAELSLARLRQLSAHEVGHTLGIQHNFSASILGRESVMDYPAPLVTLNDDGTIDISNAYDDGVGVWDKAVIAYGYREFASDQNQDSALAAHLDSMYASGMLFGSDQDARSTGGANPYAHLWDNGSDPIAELDRLMVVRRAMLNKFSARAIRPGTPLVILEEAFVPIYMFHRYQLESVPKLVGGVDYRFSVRGAAGNPHTHPVVAGEQRRALQSLLECIDPAELLMPDSIISFMQPQTIGYVREREVFGRRTGDVFDPLAAAESVADIPIRSLLHPDRAARLIAQNSADATMPGLSEVIKQLVEVTWKSARRPGREGAIQRTVDNLVLHYLIRLANTNDAAADVRAIAYRELETLEEWLAGRPGSATDSAHFAYAARRIQQFFDDPTHFESYSPVRAPAGAPIGHDHGQSGCDWE